MTTLRDTRANGEEIDWKGKKQRSILMAKHHAAVEDLAKKAKRMFDCGNYLVFKMKDGTLKLYQAYFCKVRLCPMCNWRRSLKIAFQNKQVIEVANQREKLKWIFLTLTVQNCKGSELKQTMDDMMQGFNRLMKYKKVQGISVGYFRTMEVTRNYNFKSEWYGTYHPHFHVLLAVPTNYFGKNYISQKEWVELWGKAMKLDYAPIVHVKKVKPKKEIVEMTEYDDELKELMALEKAIFETSKYAVKDSDVIRGDKVTGSNLETVVDLDKALAYKRLIGYGGLLKKIHKELNLDDAENGDLIHVNDEQDEIANGAVDVMAFWHIGLNDYVIRAKDTEDTGE